MKNTLLTLLALAFSSVCMGQIVANDDSFQNLNAYFGGLSYTGTGYANTNVIANDALNGVPSPYASVAVTQISSTSPQVSVNEWGALHIEQSTPAGMYTIVYQICEISNPNNCDTATLTIGVCSLDAPALSAQVPTCSNPMASITVSNLPSGNWTLYHHTYASPIQSVNGSGSTFTLNNLSPGAYSFRVKDANDCISLESSISAFVADSMSVAISGVFEDANSDGIPNVGDEIHWQAVVSNGFDCPLANIDVVQSTFPIDMVPATIAANGSHTFTYTQTLTQQEINDGQSSWSLWVGADSAAGSQYQKAYGQVMLPAIDGISLIAFIDYNNNGTMDGNDTLYPYANFEYEINGNGTIHHVSAFNDNPAIFESNPANTYSIHAVLDGGYWSCPTYYTAGNGYANISVAAGSGITPLYFPIALGACADTGIYLSPYENNPRPGMTFSQMITYYNVGNQAATAGTISFAKDPLLTIANISDPNATLDANGFTLNFTNLAASEVREIIVTFQVPDVPVVNLGDSLTNQVSMTAEANDVSLANNTSSLTQIATNSYDPNDKTEHHGREILISDFGPDDYLTYTIRFENTGNANAINIAIVDDLDAALDESSVQIVRASHPCVLERDDNQLRFTFSDIQLPPSEANSNVGHGQVTFVVKPQPAYAVGDVITNKASIYFDGNLPIETNETITEFVSQLSVPAHSKHRIAVYPNPVRDMMYLDSATEAIREVELFDVLGKLVLRKTVLSNSAEVQLYGLEPGMYVGKISTDTGVKTFKVLKI